MRKLRRAAVGILSALAVTLPLQFLIPAVAQAATLTPLTLKNGWTGTSFGTASPAVRAINGVVHFKGAIATAGTNPVAFTLPKAFRPATAVYVRLALDHCTRAGAPVNGRLFIQPNGVATVQAETSFADAQCLTSLDGATFAKNASLFTPLTLDNTWTGAPFGTSSPAVRTISGIVQLKGAMAAGPNEIAFTLPAGFRPASDVFVPVDLCDATKGVLRIETDGTVLVGAAGSFSDAQCFTSLDGVSFVP